MGFIDKARRGLLDRGPKDKHGRRGDQNKKRGGGTLREWLARLARIASGTGPSVALPNRSSLTAYLTVSASSGSGTLDVALDYAADGVTFTQVGVWSQKSAGGPFVNGERLDVSNLTPGPNAAVRVRWTIAGAGAPSFTFGVNGN